MQTQTGSEKEVTAWDWYGHTKINSDGTFVVESIPGDAPLQIIAICDQWLSAQPSRGDVALNFPKYVTRFDPDGGFCCPQIILLDRPVIQQEIKMTRTSQMDVRVVDADNKPIEDATVGFAPQPTLVFEYKSNFGARGFRRSTD